MNTVVFTLLHVPSQLKKAVWRLIQQRFAVAALPLACLLVLQNDHAAADVLEHWEKGTITTVNLNGVAFGNNTFVAVGKNALYTAGPAGWPWKKSPNYSFDILWSGVTFAQGVFVAVGTVEDPEYDKDIISTSVDGIKWETRLSDTDGPWNQVIFLDNQFVAFDGITDSDAYLSQIAGYSVSPDGYSWTDGFFAVSEAQVYGLAYVNGSFFAGASATIYEAPGLAYLGDQAVNSNIRNKESTRVLGPVASFSSSFTGMTSGNGTIVAVGDAGLIAYSLNQVNWSAASSGTAETLEAVTYADGFFVAVGGNGAILSSPNGVTWSARNPGSAPLFQAVTYGNGHFVAVGIDGTVAISSDQTPASITSDPVSQTVYAGGPVTFTAAAADAATYQWHKGSVALADSSRISGATTDSLTINPAKLTDIGTYSLLVKNAYGQAVSSGAVLMVNLVYATATVQTNGPGKITPVDNNKPLVVGNTYLMVASPLAGCKFVNWTGSTNSLKPFLSFVMESNLTFTANFVDVARPVNGFTVPRTGEKFTNGTITATGKARDNVGVTTVWYQLNGEDWQTADSDNKWTNWSASNLSLDSGQNTFRAYAVDAAGNCSPTNTATFTYIPSAPIELEISGKGTVEAIGGGVTIAKYNRQWLVLGDSYTLKAIPAAGYKFSGWGQGETSASLSFVMSSNLVFTPSFAQITR